MPMYFFHLVQGGKRIEDRDGSDLPNLARARQEAVQTGREMALDAIRGGRPLVAGCWEITSGRGVVLLMVPLPAKSN